MWRKMVEVGYALAAIALFGGVILATWMWSGSTVSKPLDWLESWLKMFQTIVSIVVGLKIAWNIQPIVKALSERRGG